MRRRLLIGVAVAVLALVGLLRHHLRTPGFTVTTTPTMGTVLAVTAPRTSAEEISRLVQDAFLEVDRAMSEWRPESPLSAVNEAAGERAVTVPRELFGVVERALELGARTDGAFDVTWAALWGLWDFRSADARVPDDSAIAARLHLVDFRRVVADRDAGTLFLPEEGMAIGLGGIAKGFAVDRAVADLSARGHRSFLIRAGGQVYAAGRRQGRRWRVGLRDPRGDAGDCFATVELEDECAATSGDYESFFERDGVRYHHILDPRTGRPARGLRSVTVIGRDATLCDALSTALFVAGSTRALDLAARFPGIEAVLVDDRGQLVLTPGLRGRLLEERAPRP